jgi:hypothetical protein
MMPYAGSIAGFGPIPGDLAPDALITERAEAS